MSFKIRFTATLTDDFTKETKEVVDYYVSHNKGITCALVEMTPDVDKARVFDAYSTAATYRMLVSQNRQGAVDVIDAKTGRVMAKDGVSFVDTFPNGITLTSTGVVRTVGDDGLHSSIKVHGDGLGNITLSQDKQDITFTKAQLVVLLSVLN